MKKLLLSLAAVALTVVGLGGVASMSPAAYASGGPATIFGEVPDKVTDYLDQAGAGDMPGANEAEGGLMGIVKTVINVVIGIVGVVAVVMMIVGGISFITSQGDTNKVTKARNTILYGVVGLIVAMLAFAIVNFVLGQLFNASA